VCRERQDGSGHGVNDSSRERDDRLQFCKNRTEVQRSGTLSKISQPPAIKLVTSFGGLAMFHVSRRHVCGSNPCLAIKIVNP
jgi:hypothetical protein